jgi:murein L,D-transpeptidase YcbB/YkuD
MRFFSQMILFTTAVIFLSGCATGGSQIQMENQSLRTQVSTLQNELKERGLEIESLEIELNRLNEQMKSPQAVNKYNAQRSFKSTKEFSIRNIQIALKNAGFDPGPIDGRIGKKTRNAIKNFQKAQGLTADGIVGNLTWEKLKEFLGKETK